MAVKPKPISMTEMMKEMNQKPHPGTDPDGDFLQQMIAHHQGGLQMCDHEIQHGHNRQVISMARKVRANMVREIEQMQAMRHR